MSITDTLKKDIIPAAISAVVGVIADKYILGQSLTATSSLLGIQTQRWISVGGTIFASDMIGEVLQGSVSGYIPSTSFNLAKPLISGASTAGLNYFASSSISPMNGFLLGAGSVIAGDYITNSFVKKKNDNGKYNFYQL